jgi:hypothetical protein
MADHVAPTPPARSGRASWPSASASSASGARPRISHTTSPGPASSVCLPDVYGGLDLRPMEARDIFEELVRADASVAW